MRRNTKNRFAHAFGPTGTEWHLRRLGNCVTLSSFHQRQGMPLIYLFAGEQSGDVLGAALMRAIRARRLEATFIGVGGSAMAGAHAPLSHPLPGADGSWKSCRRSSR